MQDEVVEGLERLLGEARLLRDRNRHLLARLLRRGEDPEPFAAPFDQIEDAVARLEALLAAAGRGAEPRCAAPH
ncbi:hypothetical protein [Oharaeibacter diazotrophicus]|uniref:Uncharacterized protein n=1 Tax=Oharaeibacter diazotrophicus TaxID=1920512 RepID=A0A4R6RKL8_9HYPH|nr:hypothetical protein [Oharaeibacter diazotrophicus]TDP86487.1 hypothetical protein EDD54_0362 [Oharaeibacter diazotrophicus]BBE71571.1 hypothetical protein OHA_1_01149 [Pleomorphomonas sp. SM30]GLS78332.1 hypothetical protein GCM10007904_36690 [Oharaeibacter diazotrophicus]